MKLLSTNFWLKVSASVSPSANGISGLLVAPRMCIYQCILTSKNLQSTSSSHNNKNITKQTQDTNFKETKLKVMFFGTDDFALGRKPLTPILFYYITFMNNDYTQTTRAHFLRALFCMCSFSVRTLLTYILNHSVLHLNT